MSIIRRLKIASLLNSEISSNDQKILNYIDKDLKSLTKYLFTGIYCNKKFETTIYLDNRKIIMFEVKNNIIYTRRNYSRDLSWLYSLDSKESSKFVNFYLENKLNIKFTSKYCVCDHANGTFDRWKHIQRNCSWNNKYFHEFCKKI